MATFLLIIWIIVCIALAASNNMGNKHFLSTKERNKELDEKHESLMREMEAQKIEMMKIKYGPSKFKKLVQEGKIKTK